MHKQLFNTTICGLIILPILIFSLTITTPIKADSPIHNYRVYNACDAFLLPTAIKTNRQSFNK